MLLSASHTGETFSEGLDFKALTFQSKSNKEFMAIMNLNRLQYRNPVNIIQVTTTQPMDPKHKDTRSQLPISGTPESILYNTFTSIWFTSQ